MGSKRSKPLDATLISFASPDGWAVWCAVVFTRWWLLVDHCVLRNWDRILVRAVKGLILGLAWSRYVRYCDKETLNSNKPTLISLCNFSTYVKQEINKSHVSSQDLGLGESLWTSHFFPDEHWAKVIKEKLVFVLYFSDNFWQVFFQ